MSDEQPGAIKNTDNASGPLLRNKTLTTTPSSPHEEVREVPDPKREVKAPTKEVNPLAGVPNPNRFPDGNPDPRPRNPYVNDPEPTWPLNKPGIPTEPLNSANPDSVPDSYMREKEEPETMVSDEPVRRDDFARDTTERDAAFARNNEAATRNKARNDAALNK